MPKILCDEMHVGPGDRLEVEVLEIDGERIWAVNPARNPELPAFASLKKYVKADLPDWDETRRKLDNIWSQGEE